MTGGDPLTGWGRRWRLIPLAALLVACSPLSETPTPALDIDRDADTWSASEDCDDTDPYTFPGAPEYCDGLDNDCDGSLDEGVLTTYYIDLDGDGYGGSPSGACEAHEPLVALGGDCDETDDQINPGATEICSMGEDGGVDEDCDGQIDEGGEGLTYYPDDDHDGWGREEDGVVACGPPAGYVTQPGDCDDQAAGVNPGATEVCAAGGLPPVDEDCDGLVDAEDPGAVGVQQGYLDADDDGYGDPASSLISCDLPDTYVTRAGDCDDTEPAVHLTAIERCDGLDNDCDGATDDLDPGVQGRPTWHPDGDGDGYGSASAATLACEAPEGYVADTSDCDDADAAVHPGADERCDLGVGDAGVDDDCDGSIDEEGSPLAPLWSLDADGDTFGDGSITRRACLAPVGYVSQGGDCDNGDATVFPGAPERPATGVDEDCDDQIDEGPGDRDADGDGYTEGDGDCDDADPGVSPDAAERWGNGVDDDCDGHVDADRYVSPTASTPEPAKPVYTSIQAALAAAAPGELIAVGLGSYAETLDFLGKDVALVAMEGPVGTEIDGGGAGSVVRFVGGEGPGARIRGFTISGGDGSTCPAPVAAGGGICIVGASPTVELNLVEVNAAARGGGIYVAQGAPTFVANRVRFNSASESGGGVYLAQSAASFEGDQIKENDAVEEGGGMFAAYSSPSLRGIIFEGNEAQLGGGLCAVEASPLLTQGRVVGNTAAAGGGVALSGAHPALLATLVSSNDATGAGGGVWVESSAARLASLTVVDNEAQTGGGIAILGSSVVELRHGILAFNRAAGAGPTVSLAAGSPSPTQSYDLFYHPETNGAGLSGMATRPNDQVDDPLFVNGPADGEGDDDYRLAEGSPAIDGGEDLPRYTDPDGSRCDLGAYGGPWAQSGSLNP